MRRFFIIGLWLILTGAAFAPSTTTNLTVQKPSVGSPLPNTQATLRTAFDQFDAAVAGRLSKSVAGGVDVTLTTTEARNGILEFTGTLTGNINVIVPTKTRRYIVYNNTAGAFSLTVKTSGGTGVAVTQSTRAWVYCDGTNVVSVGSGGGGSGTITSSSADQIPVFTGGTTVAGSTDLTFTRSTSAKTLTVTSSSSTALIRVTPTSSGNSGFSNTTSAHPGTGGGLFLPLVAGSQSDGPGIWWTNGSYSGLAGLWLDGGLNWQGWNSSNSNFKVHAGTGTSSNGTVVWQVRQAQAYGTHHSQGNVSGSVTFDFDNGNAISATLTGNITSTTFSNHKAGGRYVLKLTQDATGGRTWTPPTSFKYPGGVPGNMLSSGANAVDVFICDSDGTNLYCNGLFDVKNP